MKTKILWIWTFEHTGWEKAQKKKEKYHQDWEFFTSRNQAREFKKDYLKNPGHYGFEPNAKFRNWKLHKVVLNLEIEKEIKNPAKQRLKEAIKSQKMCRDLNKIVKKIESESKKRSSAWIKSENKRCKQNKFTNNKCDCAQCRDVH